MSIRNRIEDAVFLWESGRREGAILSALVAVAATSRLRFQDRKSVKDGDACEKFLSSSYPIRISLEYRGEAHPVEHIFYKWLRCELVHEGGWPVDIELMPDDYPGALLARAGGAPDFVLKLSESWLLFLINAVVKAPENDALFKDWEV